MFRHVVLFTWAQEATDEQRARVATELGKLPGAITEIRSYTLGADAGVNAGNHHFAVVADFDSVDDYLVYRDHPLHQAVITEHIKPIVASRAAIQFEV
ncbi:Dabb family protein [Streptosporangium sp. NBC_01755]|uniref:Dabb family protein n=1 Tax=unclassified Streptosporangium TaxID=2632669 RepID=UPI002DD97DA7|nr:MULTISPECIES: Dabb family protein [unclassified Streptosporangium]WSA25727.1 Dabb family protein [Streptosporangium sp. NBC_01810]WSD02883.1 Dabb family protein [Streptosporangium sp. NBC_01755]